MVIIYQASEWYSWREIIDEELKFFVGYFSKEVLGNKDEETNQLGSPLINYI